MIQPPIIEDLGDPGSWQDAMRWVRFPVLGFQPVQYAERGLADRDLLAPVPLSHDPLTSAGGAR